MSRSLWRWSPDWRTVLALHFSLALPLLIAACGQSSSPSRSTGETAARTPANAAGAAAADPVAVAPATTEQRQAAEAFYRGKTVRIVVGSGAGGGFDTTARLV